MIRYLSLLVSLCYSIGGFAQNSHLPTSEDVFKKIFYYSNIGNTDTTQSWDRALKGGAYIYQTPYGLLKKGHYQNGKKTGLWLEYGMNKKILTPGVYKNGLLAGTQQIMVLWEPALGNDAYLITLKANGPCKSQLIDRKDIKEHTSGNPSGVFITYKNKPFTGYFLHEYGSATATDGLMMVRNGWKNGEDIIKGTQQINQYRNGRLNGLHVVGHDNYPSTYIQGQYNNDQKAGTWYYSPSNKSICDSVLVTYNSDVVKGFRAYKLGKRITDTSKLNDCRRLFIR